MRFLYGFTYFVQQFHELHILAHPQSSEQDWNEHELTIPNYGIDSIRITCKGIFLMKVCRSSRVTKIHL